jgi:hypothetical protein
VMDVMADLAQHHAFREFCQPFKTPCEFYRRDRQYAILFCTENGQFDGSAKLESVSIQPGAVRQAAVDHDANLPGL